MTCMRRIVLQMNDKKARFDYREKSLNSGSSSDSDEGEKSTSISDDRHPSTSCTSSKLDCNQMFLTDKLRLLQVKDQDNNDGVLKTVDFQGLIDFWNETGFKNILTMVGAGISTSSGIPDFRSPKTGLYHNLQKYKLPHPTAIFEIDYFRKDPEPFFALAKELYPGNFKPTICHYFVKLLHDKGLLLRHYTQNIDNLERIAGIPDEKLVEAHGTFYTNHCIGCRREYSQEWAKEQIFAGNIPTCTECCSFVKPDIVFFGENLPSKFYVLPEQDFKKCDLLIIMGTSLEVQPFASLVGRTSDKCVRLLINRELVGNSSRFSLLSDSDQLQFGKDNNKRDISWLGNCDDGVLELAEKVGLRDQLMRLIPSEYRRIVNSYSNDASSTHNSNIIKSRESSEE